MFNLGPITIRIMCFKCTTHWHSSSKWISFIAGEGYLNKKFSSPYENQWMEEIKLTMWGVEPDEPIACNQNVLEWYLFTRVFAVLWLRACSYQLWEMKKKKKKKKKTSIPPQNIPFWPQITTDFTFGSLSALSTVSTMPCLTAALYKIKHIFTGQWVYNIGTYKCRFKFSQSSSEILNFEMC